MGHNLDIGRVWSFRCTRPSGLKIVSQELVERMSNNVEEYGLRSYCREHAPRFDSNCATDYLFAVILPFLFTWAQVSEWYLSWIPRRHTLSGQ